MYALKFERHWPGIHFLIKWCLVQNHQDGPHQWAFVGRWEAWSLGAGPWLWAILRQKYLNWLQSPMDIFLCAPCKNVGVAYYRFSSSWELFLYECWFSEGTHSLPETLAVSTFCSYPLLKLSPTLHFMTQPNSSPESLVKRSHGTTRPSRDTLPCSITYAVAFSVPHLRRHMASVCPITGHINMIILLRCYLSVFHCKTSFSHRGSGEKDLLWGDR